MFEEFNALDELVKEFCNIYEKAVEEAKNKEEQSKKCSVDTDETPCENHCEEATADCEEEFDGEVAEGVFTDDGNTFYLTKKVNGVDIACETVLTFDGATEDGLPVPGITEDQLRAILEYRSRM